MADRIEETVSEIAAAQTWNERITLIRRIPALYVADLMECPRCRRVTRHHPAPREAVEGEMCLCGACRTRRAFAEAAS